MIRPTPRSTRTATLFPDTTRFRSLQLHQPALLAGELPVAEPPLLRLGAQALHPTRLHHADRGRRHRQIGRHTSELQSLMRISYAVFCLKKKKRQRTTHTLTTDNKKSPNLQYGSMSIHSSKPP